MSFAASSLNAALLPYLPSSYVDAQGNLTVTVAQATTVATDVEAHADALPPAEKALFLDMVNDDSLDLAPSLGVIPSNLDVTLGRLQSAAASFSAFMLSAINPVTLAADIIQLANSEETNALNDRLSALQQSESLLLTQAGDDHAAASTLRAAALTALILGVCAAVVTVAAGAVSGIGAVKALGRLGKLMEDLKGVGDGEGEDEDVPVVPDPNTTPPAPNSNTKPVVPDPPLTPKPGEDGAEDPPPPPDKDIELQGIRDEGQKWQAVSTALNGVSQAITAGGTFVTTVAQANSKDDEADGEQAAAMAQQAQAQAAIAANIEQAAQDLITSILSFTQDVLSGTSTAMKAITG